MKLTVVLVFVCSCAALVVAEEEKYTTKYDNLDLDGVLHNERLLNSYIDCLLEKKPCSPDGKVLKDHMKDALDTGCSKCSDKQKEGVKMVVKFMMENKPGEWAQLMAKYDPDNKYMKKYEDMIKEIKA